MGSPKAEPEAWTWGSESDWKVIPGLEGLGGLMGEGGNSGTGVAAVTSCPLRAAEAEQDAPGSSVRGWRLQAHPPLSRCTFLQAKQVPPRGRSVRGALPPSVHSSWDGTCSCQTVPAGPLSPPQRQALPSSVICFSGLEQVLSPAPHSPVHAHGPDFIKALPLNQLSTILAPLPTPLRGPPWTEMGYSGCKTEVAGT